MVINDKNVCYSHENFFKYSPNGTVQCTHTTAVTHTSDTQQNTIHEEFKISNSTPIKSGTKQKLNCDNVKKRTLKLHIHCI